MLGIAALSFVSTALSSDDEFAPADAVTAQSTTQATIHALYASTRPSDSTRRFMSTNLGEFPALGFGEPSRVGYVGPPNAGGGMLQVHRLSNRSTGNFLWTPDVGEANAALQGNRYAYDGVAFSAWSNEGDSNLPVNDKRIPVYRLYSPSRDIHHFTTSRAVHDDLLNRGFGSEPVKFYVAPAQKPVPRPPARPLPKPCKAWVMSWCVWR